MNAYRLGAIGGRFVRVVQLLVAGSFLAGDTRRLWVGLEIRTRGEN